LVGLMFLVGVNVYGARGYWEDNSSLPATWTNGYVGIGTEYPYYQLDLDGTLRVTGKTYFSNNVGIGTSNPQEKLHVNGSVRGNQSGALRINTGSGYVDIGPKSSSYSHFYTDRSRYFFDTEIRVDGGCIGSYNDNLSLRTQGTTRMTILNSNGNVGIGTDDPEALLHVRKEGENAHTQVIIQSDWVDYGKVLLTLNRPNNGRQALVEYKVNGNLQWAAGTGLYNNGNPSPGYGISSDGTLASAEVFIDTSGNVGIGTPAPQSKLAVNGKIAAKEIKVTLSGWSDFVFADNYKLMPLDKLESHIKATKSLPGIPTEKEVLENGIELGEMQAKLLEKVEELTLYVIELKKENEELKKRISVLGK